MELRSGTVLLNGRAVVSRRLGPGPSTVGEQTVMLAERLPGELGDHRVLDVGPSLGDDYGPVSVPPHKLFVLGDNRDRAADSRFRPEVQGVGLVSDDAVIGATDRLLWSAGFTDFGRRLDQGSAR